MPAISRFRGIIVRLMKLPYRGWTIYANQGEHEVMVDAVTLTVIAGSAPSPVVDQVLEWARLHETELRCFLVTVRARPSAGRIAQWA